MKVINISIPCDLEKIDIANNNLDVFVELEDGYNYTLSVATPKNIQFLMDEDKKNYCRPGYPFIFVNKLTPEIIEQAVTAFAEEDEGYWLKVYHFGGSGGIIDESIFDHLKAKYIQEQKELDEDELDK